MLQNGQAGIDCGECFNQEIVTTEEESEALSKSLDWAESGNPICPVCEHEVTYEHYID